MTVGSTRRYASSTEDTREGVVVAEGLWWAKHAPAGKSANTLVSTRLTDLGGGSTFHCNLGQVVKVLT
jgi:anaerobic selenocysteine-containing dehydrogenase